MKPTEDRLVRDRAAQFSLQGCVNQRLLVDVGEDLADRPAGDVPVDAERLQLADGAWWSSSSSARSFNRRLSAVSTWERLNPLRSRRSRVCATVSSRRASSWSAVV